MFEFAANFTEVLGGVLFILWTVCGYRIGRLVFRRTPSALRRGARRNLVLLGVSTLVLLAQLVLATLSWSIDWAFASNRVTLALPVLVVPVVSVAVLAWPRLRRIAATRSDDGGEPVPAAARTAAADPRLVVPVQAAAVGAFLNFWVVFIQRPAPPYLMPLVVLWTVLAGSAWLLWLRQQRRQRLLAGRPASSGGGFGVRALRTAAVPVTIVAVVFGVISYGAAASRLPDHLNMTSVGPADWGGGPPGAGHHHEALGPRGLSGTSVADLKGPGDGAPDVRFTLTAREQQVRLASGAVVDGWTFNGQAPGPELRMHQGDLVEVTLVNELPRQGVTLHWHGLDVPNAMDGVAGVTQDAVPPGGRFIYRFRAEQVGTFWYHSHQASEEAVDRGLFGPLVVLPRHTPAERAGVDLTLMAHDWKTAHGNILAFDTSDRLIRRSVPPGTPVRLRLVNTSDDAAADAVPRTLTLGGTPFKVAAIDGTDLNEPGELDNVKLEMAIGGRYDLIFTMPDHPVRLTDLTSSSVGLVLSPDGTGQAPGVPSSAPVFDPIGYGKPAHTPFDASGPFNRRFTIVLDDRPGFYDGTFNFRPTINGRVFPDTPMFMVSQGDLVKTTLVNRGHLDHPMHLHGHHLLVLSHNHQQATGSPWWTDTLNIKPGEIFEVAFRAGNPGLWMDHCHNLRHAGQGMVMHLGYDGVTTPYEIGHATVNHPE